MATTYPTTKQSIPNPTSTDLLENATATLDHDYQHATINDTIEAIQDKLGMDSSAVTTSHDYKLSAVTGSEKALTSGTSTQTVSGLTLTSPQINFGSDANGDLIYRNGSGVTARLPIGSTDQILAVQAGLPAWIANPSASNASYSTKGIVQFDTDADTSGVTVTSGVATLNTGTTANKIVKLNASAQLPAVSGALLTNLPNPITYTNGTDTKNAADASGTQNIAHGLGKIPKKVKITAYAQVDAVGNGEDLMRVSNTVYNGTTQSSLSFYESGGGNTATISTTFILTISNGGTQVGVVTFDATNIIITWTKNSSPTGTYTLLWEAEA